MAEKPVVERLPADLPEDWTAGQIVAPTGEEVGLSEQHGYNYLMRMVNRAQKGVNAVGEFFSDGVLPIENGGTGVTSIEELKALLGTGELGKYILTGTYKGHIASGETVTLYFKPETETGTMAEFNAIRGRYGQIVLCSIETENPGGGHTAWIELNGVQNEPAFWLMNSTSNGKASSRMPLLSNTSDILTDCYTTINPSDNLRIKGNRLNLRSETGEFDYHVEMLFLMPDIEYMGMGSSGGGSPSAPSGDVHGIPAGGATGQILSKKTDTDYDTHWVDPQGGSGVSGVSSFNGRTGAVVPKTGDYTAADVGAATVEQLGEKADKSALANFVYTAQGINTIHLCTQSEYDASDKNASILFLIKE